MMETKFSLSHKPTTTKKSEEPSLAWFPWLLENGRQKEWWSVAEEATAQRTCRKKSLRTDPICPADFEILQEMPGMTENWTEMRDPAQSNWKKVYIAVATPPHSLLHPESLKEKKKSPLQKSTAYILQLLEITYINNIYLPNKYLKINLNLNM